MWSTNHPDVMPLDTAPSRGSSNFPPRPFSWKAYCKHLRISSDLERRFSARTLHTLPFSQSVRFPGCAAKRSAQTPHEGSKTLLNAPRTSTTLQPLRYRYCGSTRLCCTKHPSPSTALDGNLGMRRILHQAESIAGSFACVCESLTERTQLPA